MPSVLQVALFKILRCAVGVHFVSYCFLTLPDLGVLKIALLKTSFRCVLVCYRTCTPQKDKAWIWTHFFFFFFLRIWPLLMAQDHSGPVPLTILRNILYQRWCSSTITEKHISPGDIRYQRTCSWSSAPFHSRRRIFDLENSFRLLMIPYRTGPYGPGAYGLGPYSHSPKSPKSRLKIYSIQSRQDTSTTFEFRNGI